MEAKNEMNNDVHEIKQLDGTRIGFILKGIVVGILVGFVVSLFRLGIEKNWRTSRASVSNVSRKTLLDDSLVLIFSRACLFIRTTDQKRTSN